MVSLKVPCRKRAMKFCWGLIVMSIGTRLIMGKSSFMWEIGNSMLVNVGKRSKKTSSSSRLGTSMRATNKECTLGVESSPDMVTVSPSPWKGMIFAFYALGAGGDRGIGIDKALVASLEDEPFLPILCFFDKDSTSIASLNRFCCHSCRLATISSSSSTSSIIGGTIGLIISHHSVCSTRKFHPTRSQSPKPEAGWHSSSSLARGQDLKPSRKWNQGPGIESSLGAFSVKRLEGLA